MFSNLLHKRRKNPTILKVLKDYLSGKSVISERRRSVTLHSILILICSLYTYLIYISSLIPMKGKSLFIDIIRIVVIWDENEIIQCHWIWTEGFNHIRYLIIRLNFITFYSEANKYFSTSCSVFHFDQFWLLMNASKFKIPWLYLEIRMERHICLMWLFHDKMVHFYNVMVLFYEKVLFYVKMVLFYVMVLFFNTSFAF